MATKSTKAAGASRAADPVMDWLLEGSDPAVRLFALTRLGGESAAGPKARAARAALMEAEPVATILAGQAEDGHWGEPSAFYTDKYRGTVWQLLVLAELGADGRDGRVRAACEFIFAHSQDRESGGFSVNESAKLGGGRRSEVIPCLTGNMAFALARLGYVDDDRLTRAIDWIVEYQRSDDGDEAAPKGWPYDRMTSCFGRHSCFMGVVKSLKALAALPSEARSPKVEAKIAELAEFILAHRVYKRSHDLAHVSKPGWLKFGFPLMYQADALEILCVLAELGIRDERLGEALDAVAAKRGVDGRWPMENSFNDRMLASVERKGAASKWVTARALYALSSLRPAG